MTPIALAHGRSTIRGDVTGRRPHTSVAVIGHVDAAELLVGLGLVPHRPALLTGARGRLGRGARRFCGGTGGLTLRRRCGMLTRRDY